MNLRIGKGVLGGLCAIAACNSSANSIIVVGAGEGSAPHVKVFNGQTGAETRSFNPYGPSFTGGVRVAAGDVNGDGVADIITGAGVGGGGHVKVFDGVTNNELRSFSAYGGGFTGGVFVGSGDVNGDGRADIVTGADAGGGPHVKVFSGATGNELVSFFAFTPSFTGGVRVAAGDVNGDGKAELFTGTGPGGGLFNKYDGSSLNLIASLLPYGPSYNGGVFVAAGDVNGDGVSDVVTGTDVGGAPHVKVFNGQNGSELRSFFAYPTQFSGGVRVASGDLDGDGFADVVTGTGAGVGGHVKVFSGLSGSEVMSFNPFGSFNGGVHVGVGVNAVPEPATLTALSLGLAATLRRRRKRAA